jgi:hypothetical protein
MKAAFCNSKIKKSLVILNALNLSPLENNQLDAFIEVSKIGKNSLLVRNTLLCIFEKIQSVFTLNSKHVYG